MMKTRTTTNRFGLLWFGIFLTWVVGDTLTTTLTIYFLGPFGEVNIILKQLFLHAPLGLAALTLLVFKAGHLATVYYLHKKWEGRYYNYITVVAFLLLAFGTFLTLNNISILMKVL